MNIDAHQHFWIFRSEAYGWISEDMAVLRRDFLPEDLGREQKTVQYDGSIAVQARQTLEESRWLLQLAETDDRIKAVVGWVDLQSDRAEEQLATLAAHPKLAGVRHVVQDEPDDQFMLRPGFLRGLSCLKHFDLTYDFLVFPRQLPAATAVARRFPDQPFVLDHIAKPQIKAGVLSPWREQIQELARCPNVFCKISGLVTEARWNTWHPEDFKPYLDVVFQAFGEDRLMVGSDWPVCLLSAGYGQVIGLASAYLGSFPKGVRQKLFGLNALKFYGVIREQPP